MKFGIPLRGSVVSLSNVSVQPTSPLKSQFITIQQKPIVKPLVDMSKIDTVVNSKVQPSVIHENLNQSAKKIIPYVKIDFGLIKQNIAANFDARYSDSLPTPSKKYTAYEEISGISSSRPEILALCEYKPLYQDDLQSTTVAGDFVEAQIQLMNLKLQTVTSLVEDLKKDPELASQLDQQEGNFLLHVNNLKSKVDFLQSIHSNIELAQRALDLRDATSKINVQQILTKYYSQLYVDSYSVGEKYGEISYIDALARLGFSKNNAGEFSSTKIFLQLLYEAKKCIRAGSDEFLSMDPSVTANDKDPTAINLRSYDDPHVALANGLFPTLAEISSSDVHASDATLAALLDRISRAYKQLDVAFAKSNNDELSLANKLMLLSREITYSKALADPSTAEFLSSVGYTVSPTIGNNQLFDAVYGQIGSKITDNRTNVNALALSSLASRVVDDVAVLTFEPDYTQSDDNSVYTPGSSYYIKSVAKFDSNGFSVAKASQLVKNMTSVLDRYVDFADRFWLLPKKGNKKFTKDADIDSVADPLKLSNTLYDVYVEPNTGYVRPEIDGDPILDFLVKASSHATLRANLFLYFYCLLVIGDNGLSTAKNAQDQEAARLANTKTSATMYKAITNCFLIYNEISGNIQAAAKVRNYLANYNSNPVLSKMMNKTMKMYQIFVANAIGSSKLTRYSAINDTTIIALLMQIFYDACKRYSNVSLVNNLAITTNKNYVNTALKPVQQSLKQVVSQETKNKLTITQASFSPILPKNENQPQFLRRLIVKTGIKWSLETRITREQTEVVYAVMAPLCLVRNCRDAIEKFVLYAQSKQSNDSLNDILRVVGDSKLVELLVEKGQVQIITDSVKEMLAAVDPNNANRRNSTTFSDVYAISNAKYGADDLSVLDHAIVTDKKVKLMKGVLSNASYASSRGKNIRLMSVGIPHSFMSKMSANYRLSAQSHGVKRQKQNDVFVLDVYRSDVRYPDIIFEPISFVFEMSRFASRDEKTYKEVKFGSPIATWLDSVPTVDYGNLASPTMVYGADSLRQNLEYSFMSNEDMTNMVRNHVTNMVLETYFRIVTGIPLSERDMYIEDPDDQDRPASFLTKVLLKKSADKIVQFPTPTTSLLDLNDKTKRVSKDYASLPAFFDNGAAKIKTGLGIIQKELLDNKTYNELTAGAKTAVEAGQLKTVYSDAEHMARSLLSPKLFERIFFVPVDPDDYTIDYEQTQKSDIGRRTLQNLIDTDEAYIKIENFGNVRRQTYKLRESATYAQDMTFEKYFVTFRDYTPTKSKA